MKITKTNSVSIELNIEQAKALCAIIGSISVRKAEKIVNSQSYDQENKEFKEALKNNICISFDLYDCLYYSLKED